VRKLAYQSHQFLAWLAVRAPSGNLVFRQKPTFLMSRICFLEKLVERCWGGPWGLNWAWVFNAHKEYSQLVIWQASWSSWSLRSGFSLFLCFSTFPSHVKSMRPSSESPKSNPSTRSLSQKESSPKVQFQLAWILTDLVHQFISYTRNEITKKKNEQMSGIVW
jgi:hypothetical protein